MNNDDELPPRGPLDWVPDFREAGRIPRPGWATARFLKLAIIAVLAVITVTSTAFQIKPEEVGLVLRFGRAVRTTEPGLHFKLPFVEQVLRVPVQRQLKEEFGFRTTTTTKCPTTSTARTSPEFWEVNGGDRMVTNSIRPVATWWVCARTSGSTTCGCWTRTGRGTNSTSWRPCNS